MANSEQFEKRLAPEREKNKESKKAEMSPEDRLAAAKERADYLVKEVKNSKQQMQNILLHVAEVKKIITQIRAELKIVHKGTDENSLKGDTERIQKLQERIHEYQEEILKMREDLIKGEVQEIQKSQQNANISFGQVVAEAEKRVDALIQNITQ